jgi:hypothetical protein
MKFLNKAMILLMGLLLLAGCGGKADSKGEKEKKAGGVTQKVQLDFHVMSKCPFGAKVVNTILPVLENMGDNVDFRIHYIGREQNGELKSMHGEPEVQGNLLQICANAHGDTPQWLAFLKCQNANWRKIPEGWEECAKTANIDVAKMKGCYEGEEGKKLLAASFKISQDKKAKGSPTIFMSGQPYTGGRTEASFGRAICAEFKDAKPEYCANIPEPVKVPVTVVTDTRCKGRTCNPRRFLSFVRNTFEGAEIKELDYSDPEGKAIFEKSGQQYLPIAVFGQNVEKVENGFNRLKRRFEKLDSKDYVYPLGKHGRPPWDPKAEICDDGQDNTGNGMVDCDDETCNGTKACREEIKNRIDLFVMSQCPYGVRTVDAVVPVLDHFGKDRAKFDINLQFIGNERDGKLTSMHGQGEVDEDIRQLCAQKYYAKNYKFMDYVLCRNAAYQENHGREEANAWEACAKAGIAAPIIKKCAEGEEGQALLAESFKLAGDLGITGSPSWLLNNRFDMRARAAQQIKQAFCAKNDGSDECAAVMEIDATEAKPPVPAGSCGGGPAPAGKAAPAPAPAAKPAAPAAPAKPAAPAAPAKPAAPAAPAKPAAPAAPVQ